MVNKREGILSPGRNLSDKDNLKDSQPSNEMPKHTFNNQPKKPITKASYLNIPTNQIDLCSKIGTGSFNQPS